MLYKRYLFVPTALVSFGLLGVSAAQADDTHCYTVASLKGTYGVVATYGANAALVLAIRHFDGQGNLTRTFTLNAPDLTSTTGARKISTVTQVWTSIVHSDDTGPEPRTLRSATVVPT